MIYYVYPEGSKARRAKTSKLWKAWWIGYKLGWREWYRFVRYGAPPRRICTEARRSDGMYDYGAFK